MLKGLRGKESVQNTMGSHRRVWPILPSEMLRVEMRKEKEAFHAEGDA